jgi:Flp pilus assembly protein TadG
MKRRTQRGNAMVEFALAVSLLVPCFAGVFQFGYGFYTYNRLVAAVRSGARYAALLKYDSASTTPSTAYTTAVRNMVVYGSATAGTTPVVPGLSTSQVQVQMSFANSSPDMVKVYLTSYSVDTVFKTLTFTGKPAARFRYEGVWAP